MIAELHARESWSDCDTAGDVRHTGFGRHSVKPALSRLDDWVPNRHNPATISYRASQDLAEEVPVTPQPRAQLAKNLQAILLIRKWRADTTAFDVAVRDEILMEIAADRGHA